MQDPSAFFITFHTYGSWLHGRSEGSVDYQNRSFGQPHLPADQHREAAGRKQLKHPEVLLNRSCRCAVLDSIIETCRHRSWRLHAVHVRENHVHAVITAMNARPEKILIDLKAYAIRRLRSLKLMQSGAPVWSEHGSTRYLWDESAVYEKIHYTLNEQGKPMSRWSEQIDVSSEHEA